jgi:DNA-binding transcriptional LysR family regulator
MHTGSWDDYRFFLALHRQGSTSRAARALGVDVTTVRRRLSGLETTLGARLFRRHRDGAALTAAGEHLLARVLKLEATAIEIERDIDGNDQRAEGVVKLTAGEAFISRLVAPALGDFLRRYPAIQLELHSDNQRADLVRGEADVALRLGRPSDESLVARKIANLEFGLYASRSYLARTGNPADEAELSRHVFVGYDTSLERTPETQWLLARGVRWTVRTNSPSAILASASAGHGIASVSTLFASQESELERVLPKLKLPSREVWLVTHRDLRQATRVRVLMDFIESLFRSSPNSRR